MLYLEVEVLDNNNDEVYSFKLDKLPERCPICNTIQEPSFISAYRLKTDVESIEAIFKCNKTSCNHLFISILTTLAFNNHYTEMFSYPNMPENKDFEKEINMVSKLFVEIYNQAKVAEDGKLNHVAGMGYRKSLEFLIKDYLINYKEEDEEIIKNTFLGTCINNYLSSNIQRVAERATWLGNDETHYHRKWEDKDITDLKVLIDLTVHWMISEIQTDNYISEMKKK